MTHWPGFRVTVLSGLPFLMALAGGCKSHDFDDLGGTGGGDTASGDGEKCETPLEKPKVALFFAVQRSAEMGTVYAGNSEWEWQKSALDTFTSNVENEGITLALTRWPVSPAVSVCAKSSYSSDFSKSGELPEFAETFMAELDSDSYSDEPASGPALQAAYDAAKAYREANPKSFSEVVLTIGDFGSSCSASTVEGVADLLSSALDAGTRTWVVPGSTLAAADFETLSVAGGTVGLPKGREEALNALPGAISDCEFLPAGDGAAYVAGSTALVAVETVDDCSEATNEYFLTTRGFLRLCPATCDSTGRATVATSFPCP